MTDYLLTELSLEEKFNFISDILSAPLPKNHKKFKELVYLIENDYREFAKKENSLADEAGAYHELQLVLEEIKTIMSFPKIKTKHIIGLGGAFSSGKSSFINSLFSDNTKVRLPVDLTPTTSIPAFVVNSENISIKGYSNKGGIFTIEQKIFQNINHNLMKKLKFNLKDILPFITVEAPFRKELENLKTICFVDTPGFNYEKDDTTAVEYLKTADTILWIIDIRNGTIKYTDLKKLSSLKDSKKIYIVLNKADNIPFSHQKEILQKVKEDLEDEEINFEGISVFSAEEFEEYHFVKLSLFDFLNQINMASADKKYLLNEKIKKIFKNYKDAIDIDIKKIEKEQEKIRLFKHDLYQYIDEETYQYVNKLTQNNLDDQEFQQNNNSRTNMILEEFPQSEKIFNLLYDIDQIIKEKFEKKSFNLYILRLSDILGRNSKFYSLLKEKRNLLKQEIKKIDKTLSNSQKKELYPAIVKEIRKSQNNFKKYLEKIEKYIIQTDPTKSPKIIHSQVNQIYLDYCQLFNFYIGKKSFLSWGKQSIVKEKNSLMSIREVFASNQEKQYLEEIKKEKDKKRVTLKLVYWHFLSSLPGKEKEKKELENLKKTANKLEKAIIKKINECFLASLSDQ